MNQETRERNKNKAFLQELGHIKHNEIFKNQNEKNIFSLNLKKNSSCQPASNLRPVFKLPQMKAEVVGKLGLFQINLNHV